MKIDYRAFNIMRASVIMLLISQFSVDGKRLVGYFEAGAVLSFVLCLSVMLLMLLFAVVLVVSSYKDNQ